MKKLTKFVALMLSTLFICSNVLFGQTNNNNIKDSIYLIELVDYLSNEYKNCVDLPTNVCSKMVEKISRVAYNKTKSYDLTSQFGNICRDLCTNSISIEEANTTMLTIKLVSLQHYYNLTNTFIRKTYNVPSK